jgi:hypothetical protein
VSRAITFRKFMVGVLLKATRTNFPFSFFPMGGDKWIRISEPEIVFMPLQECSDIGISGTYRTNEQIFCLLGEQKGWLELNSLEHHGDITIEPLKEEWER